MSNGQWIHEMLAGLDRQGMPALFPYLEEDVLFRFGSFPPGRGRQTFADLWAAISGPIESLRHRLFETWEMGDTAICRGEVTYGLTDGRAVTVPFANVFKLRNGKISDYLIYVDASAVFGVAP